MLAAVYTRYQQRLRQAHAVDFDDLIMTTVQLLQGHPAVAEHYRRRFRSILVDEYQDTNHAQYVLVRELTGHTGAADGADAGGVPRAELTVVGDADQSIYAFRGATIRNIVEFETDYPDARTILLEQNYRSTQTILSAANAVISRNPGRTPKRLWTDAGAGPQIVGYVADNEHEEARFVAEEIDRLGDDDGVRPGDVAVFYRTNAQSRALEEVLIRVGLPYKVVGGTRFYERREIKDAIAYLRAIANPDDDVNLRRVLNVPKRGIGDRSEAMVAAFAEHERISFGDALDRADEAPGLGSRGLTQLAGFRDLMAGLRELAGSGAGPAEVLGEVLDRTGYLAELRASDDPQDASRVENLAELHAVATEFEQAEPDGDLADFLERVSLVADSDQIPAEDVADGASESEPRADQGVVTLMTLHTAKGLEFPVVFVTGLGGRHLPAPALAGRPRPARRGAAAGLRGPDPGPAPAVHLPGCGADGLGCAQRVPGQPVPGRPARRARRLAPPRVEHGDAAGRRVGLGRRRLGVGRPAVGWIRLWWARLWWVRIWRVRLARHAGRRRRRGDRRRPRPRAGRWREHVTSAAHPGRLVEPQGRCRGPVARGRRPGHARLLRARPGGRARGFRAQRGREGRLRRPGHQAPAAALLPGHQALTPQVVIKEFLLARRAGIP